MHSDSQVTVAQGRDSYEQVPADPTDSGSIAHLVSLQPIKEELPKFLINSDVEKLIIERGEEKLILTDVAGPAVWWAYLGTVILWSFFAVFPLVAWRATRHPAQEIVHFIWCPTWLWAVFVPVLVLCSLIEWICLRYLIVPRFHWLGEFTFLNCFHLSCWVWFPLQNCISAACHLDVFTSGRFLVSILKTLEFQPIVNQIWDTTMTASLVNCGGIWRLCVCAKVAWGLMFLQLFYGLVMVVPVQKVSYKLCSEQKGYWTIQRAMQNSFKKAMFGSSACPLWHGDAMTILANVNRMSCVLDQSVAWTAKRASFQLRAPEPDYISAITKVVRELSRVRIFFLLFHVVEKGCQLQLQATVLAISRALNHYSDRDMILSIGITCLTSLKALADTCVHVHQIRVVVNEADCLGDLPNVRKKILIARSMMCHVGLLCLGFVLLLIHVAFKLVMAFKCKHSMWNAFTGCVDLGEVFSG